MTYPTTILVDIRNDRYHPMPYRPCPRPSEGVPAVGTVCRHKSIGHHTEGFATMEEAEKHIEEKEWWPAYVVEAWDGVESPHNIMYFPYMQTPEKPEEDKPPKKLSYIEQLIADDAAGIDPYKGRTTASMIGQWRSYVASGVGHYCNKDLADKETRDDMRYDGVTEERVNEVQILKKWLDKRPHVPNKSESKAARQEKAKAGV